MPRYFDSHVHLDFAQFDAERAQVIERARAGGVEAMFVPATSPAAWPRLLELERSGWGMGEALNVHIGLGIGVHPYWSNEVAYEDATVTGELQSELGRYIELLGASAVGEIGLDKQRGAEKSRQIALFEAQLGLARELGLPVVLHQVGMQAEFLVSLERVGLSAAGGVLHGFSGDISWAQTLIKRGLFLGVGAGIVHPARDRLRATLSQLSLEHLVLETDAPQPRLRGPEDILLIAGHLAQILGVSEEHVADVTHKTSCDLFGM